MENQTVERKKYLDAIGVGRLWRKIRNRYDSKLNSVVAKDDSIAVTNGDHIGVQISSDPSNALRLKTVTQKGLYVEKSDSYSILQLGVPSQGAKKSYRLQTYDGETGSGSFVGAVIDIPNITEGSADGSISVGGTNISVHGLGTAAYTDASSYDASGSAANVLSSIQALIGANNGIAELNEQGKVPSSQLPSYVDDVREFSSRDDFPLNGESGIIYVDQSVNLPYRWSGSDYVPIGSSLAIGETMDTAYRGDRGKAAYDHATAKGCAFTSGLYKITTNAEGHVIAATAVVKSDITDLGVPAQDTTYAFDGTYNAQTNKAATVSTVNTALNGKYTKPVTGIPASDLAAGVIPAVPVQDVQINGNSILNDGIANIPVAGYNQPGVVEVNGLGLALYSDGKTLMVSKANDTQIKTGSQENRPIVPYSQHTSAFYGLAKAAGDTTQASSSNTVGNYTETAQSKINDMLNAPVNVSGTTPSITGKSGIRYVCGEVSTLSITPPASGDMEVIFTSGATATVLTVPNTVKFPGWFNPANLEANKVYDIIITNASYGVVMAWEA